MDDNSGSARDMLHALYLRAQDRAFGSGAARAALSAELERLLYRAESPDEGARAFLVDILYESARSGREGARAAMVDRMAFAEAGHGPGMEHPENKRAAGIVHVTISSEIADRQKRKQALKQDAADWRLDPYARNLAGLLLMKEWREEQKLNTDRGFYREAMEFMRDEASYLRPTRVEVAKFVLDFCKKADAVFPVVREMATSGEWPELAEEAGIWIVDHYIRAGDVGMARRAADAPGTAASVKEYAEKRFAEIGFRPVEKRVEKKTLAGMPAFRPAAGNKRKLGDTMVGMPAVSVDGFGGFGRPPQRVPPSPQDIQKKITIRGPVR